MTRVGVLTGLKREARIFRLANDLHRRTAGAAGIDPAIALSGARADKAASGVGRLIEGGAELLVSFGYAGALDPQLAAGDLVIAHAVILPDGSTIDTDPAWSQDLSRAIRVTGKDGSNLRSYSVAGSDASVLAAADKQALRSRTGAAAVDTESHFLARAAAEAGLPFIVVRAISDGAGTNVPEAAVACIGENGSVSAAVLARHFLTRPQELPAFVRLGLGSAAAGRSLSGAARALAGLVAT